MFGTDNMLIIFFEVFNLFFVGILAGAEIVVCYGVRTPMSNLEEQPQIQLRQGLIRRLRVLVPAILVLTVTSAIVVIVLEGTKPGFVFRCAGLLTMIIWMLVTFLGTVPINKTALTWRPDAPPDHWRTLVNRWERLDVARSWLAVTAYAFFLAAVALQLKD
jgi:hypothetical protein